MDDLKIYEPTPEVNEALGDLVRAAGKFALAASMQYKATRPDDYAGMADAFNKGLAETVIVVALSPDKCAQLCMDIGTERRIIVSVPARDITLN